MGIQRSVLHHNMLRHPDTEGSKVPDCTDSAVHHPVGHLLGNADRYGQYADTDPILTDTFGKLIGVINGDRKSVV